jgi:photosystem II stability/assembly factor-like uncharacterized protein
MGGEEFIDQYGAGRRNSAGTDLESVMNHRISRLTLTCVLATLMLVAIGLSVQSSGGTQAGAASLRPRILSWTEVPGPVTTTLNSVAMVSAGDGWAGGENGTLLRYDGNAWISHNFPVTTTFVSISMSSAKNGWALAVDNSSTFRQVLSRWDGARWEFVANPSPPWPFWMRDISAPNDTSAWVAGGIIVCAPEPEECSPADALGTISHWDGNSWSSISIFNVFLSSISMTSDTDGWAVGTELVQPTKQLRSLILHWDGSTWTSTAHPIIADPGGSVRYILEKVSALDAANAWATVSDENILLRWNGTAWTQETGPVFGTHSIAVVSPDNAWVVGDGGGIGHWDGSHWALVSSPVTATLTSVSMVSEDDGWAVGQGGTILHGVDLFDIQVYLPWVSR